MFRFKFPKDDSRFRWTTHIKNKMLFYGLGEGRIKRVVHSPKRVEEGIAPHTVAVMQRNDRGKKKEEIWVMYCFLREPQTDAERTRNNAEGKLSKNVLRPSAYRPRNSAAQPQLRMISAWRYPGVSKLGKQIPIPDSILEELEHISEKFDSA